MLKWNTKCDFITGDTSLKTNRPSKKDLNLVSSNVMVVDYWFCLKEDELTLRKDVILLTGLLHGILSIFE